MTLCGMCRSVAVDAVSAVVRVESGAGVVTIEIGRNESGRRGSVSSAGLPCLS
jgi:hypothetical protein